MATLKILVLSAVFFVVQCENAKNLHPKSSTIIETRCKRESEIDSKSRDIKVPLHLKPTKLLIPLSKRVYPLPRRNVTPMVIKPKVLNTVGDINKPEVIGLNNDATLNKEAGLDPVKINEPIQSINLETNSIIKENNEVKINKEKENSLQNNCDTNTDKEMKNNGGESTIEEDKEIKETKSDNADEIADIYNEDNKHHPNQVANSEINQTKTRDLNIVKSDPIEEPLVTDLLSKFKVVSGIPTQRSNMPDINSTITDNEIIKNSKTLQTEIKTKPSNITNSGIKSKKIDEKTTTKIVPLTIFTDAGKIPIIIVPRINPIKEPLPPIPTIKTINESALFPQTNIVSQMNKTIKNPEPDVLAKIFRTEPEEILIQNNKYEELLEAAAPQYLSPKLISSDLRFAPNSNNLKKIPTYYEKNYYPLNSYDNRPYSYDIKKYPNQYVVETYENSENRQSYNSNNAVQSVLNNQDNVKVYTKTETPWSQWYNNYSVPKIEDFDQKSCIQNYYQRQEYPKRIWRSWKNNQIHIRPNYGCDNTELYKGLDRYLANANAQGNGKGKGNRVYPYNHVSSGVYENQNTLPYMNQFQHRCYGY